MHVLAAAVDPAPWTAWLILVGAALSVLGAVVGIVVVLWKRIAMTDVTAAVSAGITAALAEHRAEHDRLDKRITEHAAENRDAHDKLAQQIDGVDRAREESVRHVHTRIDGMILGRGA